MGKASVSNITVPLGFLIGPKPLAMARLSVVASPLAILPLPPSRFPPLASYCPLSWHLTASSPLRVAPYCYSSTSSLRSVDPSSVTPSRGIALPPRLCPTPWIDVMTCLTVQHGFGGPSSFEFSHVGDHLSSPSGPRFGSSNRQFLLFWGAC